MPIKTDHRDKKRKIAEAAWRIILQQGMEGATVRNISREAGLSLGALRYYFPTQHDLLEYAYLLLQEKLTETVDGIFQLEMSPKEKVLKVLFALLPKEREAEIEINVRLIFKVHTEYGGKDLKEDGIYIAVKNVISNLMLLNLLRKDVDMKTETDRLYALMEGLAINALGQRDKGAFQKSKTLIIVHLNSICCEKFQEPEL